MGGEPNNSGEEDCATMWVRTGGKQAGKWNDDSCSALHPYVCSEGPIICPGSPSGPTNTPGSCSYTAVHNKGCDSYIHMDDQNTYGIQGGQTTLEQCAAAVKKLNGKNGCKGSKYFFYENGKYCNCPRDDCITSPNNNAGGPGQLYEFTDSSQTNCGDIPKNDARNIPGRDDQDIENEGYFLGEHGSNFNAAKSYCEEKGTTLALIKDGESQQKAAAACGKHTCWIGLVEHGGQD